MRILVSDPGVTSGYCYAEIDEDGIAYYPFQLVDDVDDFWRRLNEFQPRHLIMEDFEFRRGKMAAGGLNLFPQQLIGVGKLYSLVADHQCALYLQKAAQGKSYYTDKILKTEKLYIRGKPHAMDATRHLLQWLTFGAGYQFMEGKRISEFVELMVYWKGGDKS